MTALCGAIRWRGGPPGTAALSGMQAALAPYGAPEAWSGDAGACAVAVSVHRHLGVPAMAVAEGGALVACVDAHLYRRTELAARLGAGYQTSDAGLVLAAYARWGREMLDQLTGMYAIAVVDRRRGGLLLARDHSGGRTMSVHEGDGVVAFATTAMALTGFEGVGHELDLERAVEVMLLAYSTDRTFVRRVRAVLPGTAMWVDGQGARAWRWWTPPEKVVDAGSLSAHATALRGRLEESVDGALAGAGQVGVMLSGGLDSTSVAALAAQRLAPATLRSYTSVPPAGWSGPTAPGWIPSERFAVEALGRRYPNLRSRFVDERPDTLFGHHEPLWELGSPPVRNPLNMSWVLTCYRMAADDGVDVLLGGSSGNLAFSADGPLWLLDLARRGRLVSVAREARAFARGFDMDVLDVLRRELLAHLFPGLKRRRAARAGADPLSQWTEATALAPGRLAQADLVALIPELGETRPQGIGRDTSTVFLNGGAQGELFAALRALWRIDVRDPTADRRLVETAVVQPERWRRHNGEWRAVARAAMRDVLPAEIVDRPTSGAQQPDWFDRLTAARSEIRDELDAIRAHPASCEVIDVDRLERLVAEWPDRSRMAETQVVNRYQVALSRSLFLSRYLRWFEERGRRVRAGGPAVIGP